MFVTNAVIEKNRSNLQQDSLFDDLYDVLVSKNRISLLDPYKYNLLWRNRIKRCHQSTEKVKYFHIQASNKCSRKFAKFSFLTFLEIVDNKIPNQWKLSSCTIYTVL